jgi:hypothetical protein
VTKLSTDDPWFAPTLAAFTVALKPGWNLIRPGEGTDVDTEGLRLLHAVLDEPACPRCAGTEVCHACNGNGGTREDANAACPSANAPWTECAACAGTGTCPECPPSCICPFGVVRGDCPEHGHLVLGP